jgi:hypothetical protein
MSDIYSYFVAPASVIIPLIIGVRKYNVLDRSFRFLIAFLSISLLASILGKLSAYFFHTNILVNELYTLGEFLSLTGFYYFQFSSLKMHRLILFLTVVFVFLCVGLMFVFIDVDRFDDYSTSLSH